MSNIRNKLIKSTTFEHFPAISPNEDFVLLRLWTPTKNGKESSYTKTLLPNVNSKIVNVGHLSMYVKHNDKHIYVSHWPKNSPSSPEPIPSVNLTIQDDLEEEGLPKSYIILYGLDTNAIIARFERDICNAPWALFGNKKNRTDQAAYNCASTVYELLQEGGLFHRILTERDKLKEIITPINVAELTAKASNIEAKKYKNLPTIRDLIENELLDAAKKDTEIFSNFLEESKDLLTFYQTRYKTEWPKFLRKLHSFFGKTAAEESERNSNELLKMIKFLKKIKENSSLLEQERKTYLNDLVFKIINQLISKSHIDLKYDEETGFNPLHYAIIKKNMSCIKALIKKFPNKINEEVKLTPSSKPSTIRTRSNFLNSVEKQKPALTPLDLAIDSNDIMIIDYIKTNGGISKNRELVSAEILTTRTILS